MREIKTHQGGENVKANSATKTQSTKLAPDLKSLEVFAGKWNMEGEAFESPFGPAGKVSAIETFEWLDGKLFLIHRLNGKLNQSEIACIEIIGSDPSSQSYSVHSFYNDGNKNVWQLQESNGRWNLTGDWKVEGGAQKVRCAIAFDAGNKRTGKWEYSNDGSNWEVFWDTRATQAF